MRLSGLASGIDTDLMVEQMMKVENMKVDRAEGDKQILEWKKENLNSLNKDLANFVLDSKKDLGYNSLGRPGNLDWAKAAVSSDETVGTAKAGKGALEGRHEIEVVEVVRGISGASVKNVTNDDWVSKGTAAFSFKIDNGTENGVRIDIDENASLSDIAKAINDSDADVNASYDANIERFFISSKKEGASAKIRFETVDGEEDVRLNDFLQTIDVEMKGFTSTGNDKVQTKLRANRNFFGADGEITYNGAEGIKIDSNTKTINGVNFNFVENGKFTVNVNTNTDAIVDKVKEFVENYNKIVEQASNLVGEKRNRDFRPLTADEKEAMSEKEVEAWEEKAKSGLLNRDMDIERMLSNLRSDLYKNLEGASGMFKNITELGITTQKYQSGSSGGLLEINEDKLRDAISKDADSVMELMFEDDNSGKIDPDKQGQTTNSLVGSSNKGLVSRIFDNITDGMKNIIHKSGPGENSALFRKVKSNIMTDFVTNGGKYSGRGSVSDIDNDMLNQTKKIEQLRERLAKKEEMYFAQFAAMEKAMYQANSQSDWLMQQTQMM